MCSLIHTSILETDPAEMVPPGVRTVAPGVRTVAAAMLMVMMVVVPEAPAEILRAARILHQVSTCLRSDPGRSRSYG